MMGPEHLEVCVELIVGEVGPRDMDGFLSQTFEAWMPMRLPASDSKRAWVRVSMVSSRA
jgi:hypothetical protein